MGVVESDPCVAPPWGVDMYILSAAAGVEGPGPSTSSFKNGRRRFLLRRGSLRRRVLSDQNALTQDLLALWPFSMVNLCVPIGLTPPKLKDVGVRSYDAGRGLGFGVEGPTASKRLCSSSILRGVAANPMLCRMLVVRTGVVCASPRLHLEGVGPRGR